MMIIGSGMIARAFSSMRDRAEDDALIYAAGVSNSRCDDAREFQRDHERLERTLASTPDRQLLVYFSTCSIYDPALADSAYVRHKLAMEDVVRRRASHVVVRLPQVAGITPNPHTLLNYLYARIVRSERFQVWGDATRNIIDVQDVVSVVRDLVAGPAIEGEIINIANSRSTSVRAIVREMERVLGVEAIYDTLDKGTGYAIDTGRISATIARCGIVFDEGYVGRVIGRYYGPAHDD